MNGNAQEAPGSPPPIVLHPEVGLLNKIMVIRANMIFVADVVDIVRRANIFMWSNFAPHENLSVLCGRNLLSMKRNFAPYASLDQQTWTRSGLTISPTNDDSCIKSWNGGTLLQVFTKFGLVVPLTYRSLPWGSQLGKHQNQILGNTTNLPDDWEACWGPHLAGPLMKFPWARRSKPPLFRQHWARSLPIKGWDYSTRCDNKSDIPSNAKEANLFSRFLSSWRSNVCTRWCPGNSSGTPGRFQRGSGFDLDKTDLQNLASHKWLQAEHLSIQMTPNLVFGCSADTQWRNLTQPV